VRGRPEWILAQVDWKERDEQLANQVREVVHHLFEAPGRPLRITIQAICREVGHFHSLRHELERLPLTAKVLAESVETHETFAARRVRWAAELYRQEALCPTYRQLVERASVRADLVARWPLVQKAMESALQMLSQFRANDPPYSEGQEP
jgi:hypothetical protein